MSDMHGIFKYIQRKFPVCNVIDARTYSEDDVLSKCKQKSKTMDIKRKDTYFTVTLCTGSFNVYVLNIEEKSE
jgi:hypothetical protein